MANQKLAVFADFCVTNTIQERLKQIKTAGFDGVMLNGTDEKASLTLPQQIQLCKDIGLDISCIHLSFDTANHDFTANDIWMDESLLYDRLCYEIELCGSTGVRIGVFHLTYGGVNPAPNEVGMRRIEALCELAQKNDVLLACENRRNTNHIAEVFKSVCSPALCFCYDTGHEEIYQNGMRQAEYLSTMHPMEIIHLHDNFGIKDLHMLPFDGSIDYSEVISQMKSANYSGDILLEPRMMYSPIYENVSPTQFLQSALKKAARFREMLVKHIVA